MCAALNAAGVVSACASADVDVLLFGALANYRHLHLQASLCSFCRCSWLACWLAIMDTWGQGRGWQRRQQFCCCCCCPRRLQSGSQCPCVGNLLARPGMGRLQRRCAYRLRCCCCCRCSSLH